MSSQVQLTPDQDDQLEEARLLEGKQPVVLQTLRPRHKQVCALVAQGLPLVQISQITGYTAPYVSFLMRQPICIEYVAQMNEVAAAQLEAMFGKAVVAVANALDNGNVSEQLKAVRLHGELTKRIGSRDVSPNGSESSVDRLSRLAERLTGLLVQAKGDRDGRIIQGTFSEVPRDASVRGDGLLGQGSADEADCDGRQSSEGC